MFGNRGPFKSVLELLPFNQSAMYAILEKIVQLVESWMYEVDLPKEALDHASSNRYNRQVMPSTTNELQKEKVNVFFGYTIAMVIQKFDRNKRKVDYIHDEKEIAEQHEIDLYLRNMRILHQHALTDSNYMTNCCYLSNDIMLNRGGQTLVALQYFQFAIELVGLLDDEISEQEIRQQKGDSYNLAMKNVNLQRSELQSKFENCANSSHALSGYTVRVDCISGVIKDKIFVDILQKTLRSMFNCALKTVRENTTGHYARISSKDTHREKLKHDIAKRQMKVDGVKAEKAIQMKREGKTGKQ